MRTLRCLATTGLIFGLVASPLHIIAAQSLSDPLVGLLSKASYMNFFLTSTSAKRKPFEPEGGSQSIGAGFELAFSLKGGKMVPRRQPSAKMIERAKDNEKGRSCTARFDRGELPDKTECSDTTVKGVVTRSSIRRDTTYEQTLEIEEFSWKQPSVMYDFGVSFTQSGAFVPNNNSFPARLSLREVPAVTLYASFVDLPILRDSPLSPSVYVGARAGFLTLHNGRFYGDSSTMTFSAETFQLGPVAGVMTEIMGLGVFAEASYLWREFRNVSWDTDKAVPTTLPRRIDLTGVTLLFGMQFDFAK